MISHKFCIIALGFSLLLAGCSLNAPIKLSPRVEQQISPRFEITDTPFIDQDDFQCGPASLAMVMNYHGANVLPAELADQVFSPKAKGSFPVEMDVASRRQGFISFPVQDIESVIREVDAGHPVLVLQNLSIDWYPMWHFAVVVGYDLKRRTLILRSGDQPRRQTSLHVFENTWKRSDHWGRVVLPPRKIPVTATPVTYIKLISQREQVGQVELALSAYRTAMATWPDSHLPPFALANLLQSQGRTGEALEVYDQLLVKYPRLAAGWNNYAYALLAAGCNQQAEAAAVCGVMMNPEDTNLNNTLKEIRSSITNSPLTPNTGQCPVLRCQ